MAAAAATANSSDDPLTPILACSPPRPPLSTFDGCCEDDIREIVGVFDGADEDNVDDEMFLSCCCLVSSDSIWTVEVLTTSDGRPEPSGTEVRDGEVSPDVTYDDVFCCGCINRVLALAVTTADDDDDGGDEDAADSCCCAAAETADAAAAAAATKDAWCFWSRLDSCAW